MSLVSWPRSPAGWATWILAVVVILLGLPMLIMGADLASLGGSWYYVLCGAVVVVAGVLMLIGRVSGAFVYLAAWAITWVWAFWEVGLDGWGLLPRVFGPTIIAVLVFLTIPVLRRAEITRAHVAGAAR